jgi:hypothetical protein
MPRLSCPVKVAVRARVMGTTANRRCTVWPRASGQATVGPACRRQLLGLASAAPVRRSGDVEDVSSNLGQDFRVAAAGCGQSSSPLRSISANRATTARFIRTNGSGGSPGSVAQLSSDWVRPACRRSCLSLTSTSFGRHQNRLASLRSPCWEFSHRLQLHHARPRANSSRHSSLISLCETPLRHWSRSSPSCSPRCSPRSLDHCGLSRSAHCGSGCCLGYWSRCCPRYSLRCSTRCSTSRSDCRGLSSCPCCSPRCSGRCFPCCSVNCGQSSLPSCSIHCCPGCSHSYDPGQAFRPASTRPN